MRMVEGLDVSPQCEIIWNDPDAEDEWGVYMQRARGLSDKLEYEMVKRKLRECATMHVRPQNYDEQIEKLMQDGLVWLPIRRTQVYSGFSHQHFPVRHLDENSMVYGVLSHSLEGAREFRRASENKDHMTMGELLGYPGCCSKFFTEVWPEYIDPMYQIAENSEFEQVDERHIKLPEIHMFNQRMLRYVNLNLGTNFPCSLNCEESIEIGKDWYRLAQDVDPKEIEALEKILSLSGSWGVLYGIAIITTEPFTVVANSAPTAEKWIVEWDKVETY